MIDNTKISSAEILLHCKDFSENLSFFTKDIGFKLKLIFPADSPRSAIISGYGLTIRLEKSEIDGPLTLRLIIDKGASQEYKTLKAPNGSELHFIQNDLKCDEKLDMPPLKNKVVVKKLEGSSDWINGRAGMQYRDLIPDRLGGRFIVSSIRIKKGGPVPDYVHYHHVRFQMIYCYKGWVRAVYEDQGEPFVMHAGDCVLQPPHIRHQVLECSDNFEVIEVGCPAEHKTLVDHHMELPTSKVRPDRDFSGQKFVLHKKKEAQDSLSVREDGFKIRDTSISKATNGEASVLALTPSKNIGNQGMSHDAEFLFFFVLGGQVAIEIDEQVIELDEGGSFSMPANKEFRWQYTSKDLELLEVALPAEYHRKLL